MNNDQALAEESQNHSMQFETVTETEQHSDFTETQSTTTAEETKSLKDGLSQSFCNITAVILRNLRKWISGSAADHKRYQIVPLYDIGTPGCLIPIEKKQMDGNENKAQVDHRLLEIFMNEDYLKKN